jgi:hypothetical protein
MASAYTRVDVPTIARLGPYRFFFFSGDRNEPRHGTSNGRTCWPSSGSLACHWQSRRAFRRTSFERSRASWLSIETSSLRPGMSISEVEVIPVATELETSEDELTVSLSDGRRISVPLAWFPRLLNATPEERAEFRLIGGGEGIHWPRVDEDISVAGLLRGSRAGTAAHPQLPRSLAAEFRRREHGDTWHWCTSCSMFPTEDYFVRSSKPAGNLCNECMATSQAKHC